MLGTGPRSNVSGGLARARPHAYDRICRVSTRPEANRSLTHSLTLSPRRLPATLAWMVPLPALMHPTQVARPFHTKGWVYEEKIGWLEDGGAQEIRPGSPRQPERPGPHKTVSIVQAPTKLKPKTFTLDGEIAVFDGHLISRFEWIRHLNRGDLATPPLFMVFDLLHLDATDYRAQPFTVRRKAPETDGGSIARWRGTQVGASGRAAAAKVQLAGIGSRGDPSWSEDPCCGSVGSSSL
jgi:hypothetical protein